jgi:hypothetical protein
LAIKRQHRFETITGNFKTKSLLNAESFFRLPESFPGDIVAGSGS